MRMSPLFASDQKSFINFETIQKQFLHRITDSASHQTVPEVKSLLFFPWQVFLITCWSGLLTDWFYKLKVTGLNNSETIADSLSIINSKNIPKHTTYLILISVIEKYYFT